MLDIKQFVKEWFENNSAMEFEIYPYETAERMIQEAFEQESELKETETDQDDVRTDYGM